MDFEYDIDKLFEESSNEKKTDFHKYRLPKAKQYEKEVIEKLKRSKFIVVQQGLEHTHPEFHTFLTQYNSGDPTSLFNRYQPDTLATKPNIEKTCFIEVKASNTIEKDAYLIYSKLHQIGCKVLICIKNKWNNEYWVPLPKIELYTAEEWKLEHPHWEHKPIDNDNWFAPRLWVDEESKYYNPQKYYNWKFKYHGSGTPHRYFKFPKMEQFKLWVKYRNKIFEWLKGKEVYIGELYQQKINP